MTDRRAQIAEGLDATRQRIDRACADADRDPRDVTLVVVTKTFPASDVRLLADLGVRDVGENRHPEAAHKAAECADLPLRWHFIGQLQSNKAAAVASYANVVHSVDRVKLVAALARGRAVQPDGEPRPLDCLVQVSLDPPTGGAGRGGATAEQVPALVDAIADHPSLRLRGVMAVAPLHGDPDPAFASLREISRRLQADVPGATWVSAGMSGDLEAAIRHGATHVRVGSAILGKRPTPR